MDYRLQVDRFFVNFGDDNGSPGILQQNCRQHGVIWDHFPKNAGMLGTTDRLFKEVGHEIDIVINLTARFEVLEARLSGRWTHLPSGRVYNTVYNPPLVKG
jgi:adenylate kinase family enzyme